MAKGKIDGWEKRFVPVERVQPLVLFLEKTYGNMVVVSDVLGIPPTSLRTIKSGTKRGVKFSNAQKIVDAVLALRHGDRSWSLYENDGPPRMPTTEEKRIAPKWGRWHAGRNTGSAFIAFGERYPG